LLSSLLYLLPSLAPCGQQQKQLALYKTSKMQQVHTSVQFRPEQHQLYLANASYRENKAADITKGFRAVMKIDHNKALFDTTLCTTFSELAITNPKAPYVIGTQVHLDSSSDAALVDTIATHYPWIGNLVRFNLRSLSWTGQRTQYFKVP
jgi:hypothetical protein